MEWSGLFVVEYINSGVIFHKKTYNSDITIDGSQVKGVHVDVVGGVHISTWKENPT